MATINLALNVQVIGGPQVAVASSKLVEAYDKVEVTIDPGGSGAAAKEVQIQPGASGQVNFLLIKSSLYSEAAELTYRVKEGATEFPASPNPGIKLDQAHLYAGGALAVFGIAPTILKFTNTNATTSGKKAMIEILVGRDATP